MKLVDILNEDLNSEKHAFKQWLISCRAQFPNCTVTGDYKSGAQAVDWTSNNNEVAGDWNDGKGVVYAPGSKGASVVDTINASDVVTEAANNKNGQTVAMRVAKHLDRHFYVYDDHIRNDNSIRYVIEERKAQYTITVNNNVISVTADLGTGATRERAREIKTSLSKFRSA